MTNPNDLPDAPIVDWKGGAKRIVQFGKFLIRIEGVVTEVAALQSEQQKLISDLSKRVEKLEAQNEIIIRLLERDRRD